MKRAIGVTLMALSLIGFAFLAKANAQQLSKESFLKPRPIDTSTWSKPAMTIASSSACFGGVSSDLLTSRGMIEGNPLLRNRNGSPNLLRAGLIGFGACGSTFFLDKKHPKAANIIRFVIGGVHGFAAVHNQRLK